MPPPLGWCSPLVPCHPCSPSPLHYLGLSLHHKGNILNADPKLAILVVAGLWGPGRCLVSPKPKRLPQPSPPHPRGAKSSMSPPLARRYCPYQGHL